MWDITGADYLTFNKVQSRTRACCADVTDIPTAYVRFLHNIHLRHPLHQSLYFTPLSPSLLTYSIASNRYPDLPMGSHLILHR